MLPDVRWNKFTENMREMPLMVIPSSLHSVLLSGQFQGWRSKSGGGASTSKTGEGQRLKKSGGGSLRKVASGLKPLQSHSV